VYNRWGKLAAERYFKPNSTQTGRQKVVLWNGHWQNDVSQAIAPEGTYFYVVKYTTVSGSSQTVKGYLQLVRE
jgi:hypothetical protein